MNKPTSGKERAALRAEANRLAARVHVGQHGLSPTLLASLDDALRTHELVKVQLGRALAVPPKELAATLAKASRSEVVQVIGRTTTLYRHNADLERKPGAAPAWRD